MTKYHVRWRHIPQNLMFTPLMYIGIDHTVIETIDDASEYDIQLAIAEEFKLLRIWPEHVHIESFQKM